VTSNRPETGGTRRARKTQHRQWSPGLAFTCYYGGRNAFFPRPHSDRINERVRGASGAADRVGRGCRTPRAVVDCMRA